MASKTLPDDKLIRVRTGIAEFFPNDAEEILGHCVRHEKHPLGYDHVDVLVELTGQSMNDLDLDELRVGYVLFSSYYFLLDALVDGHLKDGISAVYLTPLLSGALFSYQNVCQRLRPDALSDVHRMLSHYVSENATAITLEKKLHRTPLTLSEAADYQSIVGRSNSVLALYCLIAVLTGKDAIPKVKDVLSDLVYYLQFGDDLSDWRGDYRAQCWTSFLRRCFLKAGKILQEPELEEIIYIGGMYEQQAAAIIKGLDAILGRIDQMPEIFGHGLRSYVLTQRTKMLAALTNVVGIKLTNVSCAGTP